jgi:hypothetical protein
MGVMDELNTRPPRYAGPWTSAWPTRDSGIPEPAAHITTHNPCHRTRKDPVTHVDKIPKAKNKYSVERSENGSSGTEKTFLLTEYLGYQKKILRKKILPPRSKKRKVNRKKILDSEKVCYTDAMFVCCVS